MKAVGRLVDGAQEWGCPVCGRRVVLRRGVEPRVLDAGDESVIHVGPGEPSSAADIAERYGLGPIQEIPRPPAARRTEVDGDDRRWLAEIGIDWDGDAAA